LLIEGSLHQTEKIVRQARNSEEQFPTDSADAPQTRRERKVYQINQLPAKRRSSADTGYSTSPVMSMYVIFRTRSIYPPVFLRGVRNMLAKSQNHTTSHLSLLPAATLSCVVAILDSKPNGSSPPYFCCQVGCREYSKPSSSPFLNSSALDADTDQQLGIFRNSVYRKIEYVRSVRRWTKLTIGRKKTH
jgi:hypothetical protein